MELSHWRGSTLVCRIRPIPAGAGSALDPVEQELELFRSESEAVTFAGRPGVGCALQSLAEEAKARTIPEQDLETVAGFIGEGEQESAGGILLQGLLHQEVEPVEALAAIDGRHRQEDPSGGRKVQHGRRKWWTTWAMNSGLAGEGSRSVISAPTLISTVGAAVSNGVGKCTSRNRARPEPLR